MQRVGVFLYAFGDAVWEIEMQVGMGELAELDARGALAAGVFVCGMLTVQVLCQGDGKREGMVSGLGEEELRVTDAVFLYLFD